MGRRGQNEGSIYRREDGRWAASLTLGYAGGKRKRKTYYGRTRREVQEQLTAALRDRDRGLPILAERQTVEQYLLRWLDEVVCPSVRPKTYEAYHLNVRRVVPHLGRLRLEKLGPANVQACYSALLAGGLSRRSVEQAHTVLHRALRQALQWNLIGRNPTEAVAVPRPKPREMRALSAEQVAQLFAASAAAGDPFHTLWMLLATTGLRLGEATGLQWADVDLKAATLVIRRALQRQRGAGLVFVEPKSQRSRRTVHLAAVACAALREHRLQQAESRLAAAPNTWHDRDLVFCTGVGTPLDPARVNEALHRALDRAGLPRVRVHDLRHTAATLLLERGVHPKIVQELLGHSTITLTLNTYSHVAPALHAEVARHMDALFG